jgi:tetratricopeptide (TPR) repeat protein
MAKPKFNAPKKQQGFERLFAQASALYQQKKDQQACEALEEVIKLKPEHLFAHKMLGTIRSTMGMHQLAKVHWAQAVLLEPEEASNFYNFGSTLQKLGQLDDAVACYEQALTLKKDYAIAMSNLGAVYREKNEFEKALGCYQAVIEMDKYRFNDYLNYALILSDLNYDNEAIEVCELALQLGASDQHAHFNKGFVLAKLMQDSLAERSYLQALQLNPDFVEAQWNLSHLYLRNACYKEGWKLFESRWKTPHTKLWQRTFHQPRWNGDFDVAGRTILLHTEQGLGDTIQFSRYALLLEQMGAKVVLEVQPALVNVMKSMSPTVQVVEEGNYLPPFDCYCPQMSLPLAFDQLGHEIPAPIPYVHAEPVKSAEWKEKLGEKKRPRVGLVWAGGFHAHRPETWSWNKRRNLPLEMLAHWRELDVDFVSLQKGEPSESDFHKLLESGWQGPKIHNFVGELKDFTDTAALIDNLDLVISVDTSTLHLAGAMGKPVWLLNRFDSCWRWPLGQTGSLWYPTMRIFKQPAAGRWDVVVAEVTQALGELLKA